MQMYSAEIMLDDGSTVSRNFKAMNDDKAHQRLHALRHEYSSAEVHLYNAFGDHLGSSHVLRFNGAA